MWNTEFNFGYSISRLEGRATLWVRDLDILSFEEWLEKLEIFNIKKRRLRENVTTAFKFT